MEHAQVKIQISGKVKYDDEITVSQAAQIITFLNAGDAIPVEGTLGSGPEREPERTKSIQSPRDAIEISGAKTNPEKIAALGAYVLQDGGETFKAEDVKTQFRRARETAPGNFSRDLSTAVSFGWIAEAEVGEYYVTNKLDGVLASGFSFASESKGRPAARRASRATKAKAKVVKPEVFAEIDEFPTTMDGYPPYSKAKSNRDKLLWALAFAKGQQIAGLTNKDLAWLTDHIGGGVPSAQISAAFNSAKSAGYANRSTRDQTLRVTDEGREYLKGVGAKAN